MTIWTPRCGLFEPRLTRQYLRWPVFIRPRRTNGSSGSAFDGAAMRGIIAFREGWIDQLYVLPTAQRRGVGKDLLQVAQNAFDRLQLWTFQRNAPARRFYEARGFALIQQTDGARNEEKEPDALYLWTR